MNKKIKAPNTELLYLKIASDVKKAIETGELKPGDTVTSERKLAQNYSVSYDTVRKAIQSLVDEKLLVKVQGKGVFVKDNVKVNNKKIGVLIDTLNLSYYADMVEVMEKLVTGQNYEFFLICMTDADGKADQGKMIRFLEHTTLDGLLVAEELRRKYYEQIKAICPGMHMIFLDGAVAGAEVDYIKFDDESGAFAATEHLIRQGRKKILFIDSDRNFINAGLREHGYLAAMQRYGMEPWVKYAGFHYDNGHEAMQKIMSDGKMPDAIFCVTDMVAMGAMQVLADNKITVPDQVAVVGFSNLREASFTRPRISSVKVDVKEISRLAVTEMIDKIEKRSKSLWQVIFPTHLIVRESSTNKSINITKQTKQITQQQNKQTEGVMV
jgi:LacI family transcriptional regulator